MKVQWEKAFRLIFGVGFLFSACTPVDDVLLSQKTPQLSTETKTPSAQEPHPTVTVPVRPRIPTKTNLPPTRIPLATDTAISAANDHTKIVFSRSKQIFDNAISFSVVIADIDLDQDNDIFFANYTAPSQLWLNDGSGAFSNSGQVFGAPNAQSAHGVGIRDLNGDAYPDIFLIYHNTSSKVFFNDGSGGFIDSQQNIGTANDGPQSIVLGDIDRDGDIDAFITFSRAANRLWINTGNGIFERSETEFGGRTSSEMLVQDFNNDEIVDLFYCYIDRPGEIWFNDGQGHFVDAGQAIGDQYGCDDLDSGDIDGDGDHDIVLGNIEKGVKIWLNENNTGVFFESGSYFAPGTIKTKLLDADLDGDLDLITAHVEDGNILWINSGPEGFMTVGQLFGTEQAHSLATGDLDADADIDVVVGSGAQPGQQDIYFNE